MIKVVFGAGSVPCKQQHPMSMEIELARPTTQAGTCQMLGIQVALLALAFLADDPQMVGRDSVEPLPR
jgi:hypothetical protein